MASRTPLARVSSSGFHAAIFSLAFQLIVSAELRLLCMVLISVWTKLFTNTSSKVLNHNIKQCTELQTFHVFTGICQSFTWDSDLLYRYVLHVALLIFSSELNWLEFLSLVGCYKIVFNLNRLNFVDYFELRRNTKTKSNHPYKIQTKLAKLNCYKHSFFVKINKSWHDLPCNVINCRDSPNVNKFKLRLKNHINIYWMDILYLLMIFLCYLTDFYIFLFTSFYSDLDWFFHFFFRRSLI